MSEIQAFEIDLFHSYLQGIKKIKEGSAPLPPWLVPNTRFICRFYFCFSIYQFFLFSHRFSSVCPSVCLFVSLSLSLFYSLIFISFFHSPLLTIPSLSLSFSLSVSLCSCVVPTRNDGTRCIANQRP